MKILCVSDQVVSNIYNAHMRERFGDIDLVLSCGDLPYYYMEFIASTLNVPCLYVHGNHDQPEHKSDGRVLDEHQPEHKSDGRVLDEPGGWTNLDRRTIECKGILIGGLEGCLRYKPGVPYQYSDLGMHSRSWQMIPALLWNRAQHGRFLDILITHAPPRGIHDGNDLAHRGFEVFLHMMDRFQPRYLLHGHKHIYGHETRKTTYQQTQVINVHPFYLLEWEPT
jgi:Icc-related predicted phosphoesterase